MTNKYSKFMVRVECKTMRGLLPGIGHLLYLFSWIDVAKILICWSWAGDSIDRCLWSRKKKEAEVKGGNSEGCVFSLLRSTVNYSEMNESYVARQSMIVLASDE